MRVVRLPVQEMTRERFAPYGILLDRRGTVELDLGGGIPAMTGATSERRPLRFEFMARHRQTMQVFSPLAESRSIICVAPPATLPVPDEIAAFYVNGQIGRAKSE